VLLCGAFVALLYFGRALVFGDFHPVSDFAADMLLEGQIDHGDVLLTGHYSRFHFNHPGPFFFYYHHLVHRLLDWTTLSATASWTLATLFLNVLFIAVSALLACRLLGEPVALLPLFVFTAISVSLVQTDLLVNWMPYQLVAPYMAFVLTSALIAQRRYRYWPLAIALASILIHGYVTLIVLTLPVLAAAALYGYATNRSPVEPREWRSIAWGLVIGIVFASPMLFDWLLHDDSNPERIAAAFAGATGKGSLFDSTTLTIDFAGRIFFKNLTVLHVAILWLAVSFGRLNETPEGSRDPRKILAWLFLLITALFVAYYQTAPRPLYELTGMFYSALCVVGVSMAGAIVVMSRPGAATAVSRIARPAALTCVVLTILSLLSIKPPAPENANRAYIADLARAIQSATAADGQASIAYQDHSMWEVMTGLLLELDRQDYDSCTTWPDMAYLYTRRKICPADRPANVSVVKAADCAGNCAFIAGKYGLVTNQSGNIAQLSQQQYPGQRRRKYGRSLVRSGQLEKAIEVFESALEMAPDDPMAHHDLAVALDRAGDRDRALAEFEAGLALDPHNGWLLRGYGNALRHAGRIDEAIAQHRLALRALPDADSHDALGVTLLAAGNEKQAVMHFQRALTLDPKHAGATRHLKEVADRNASTPP